MGEKLLRLPPLRSRAAVAPWPWNTRDVTLRDLDGNKLNFTSPLRGETRTAPESFKEIMDRAIARMSEEERGGGG